MVFVKVMKRAKMNLPPGPLIETVGIINKFMTGVNIGTKQKGEGGDLKKKAKVSGEIHKEKKKG